MPSNQSAPEIIVATSQDPAHPPSAIIDGSDSTFWLTTGMFPQEFVLAFPVSVTLSRVKLVMRGVRAVAVYACNRDKPVQLEKLFEAEVPKSEGSERYTVSEACSRVKCRFMKVIILDGWQPFTAVYAVQTEGDGPMVG